MYVPTSSPRPRRVRKAIALAAATLALAAGLAGGSQPSGADPKQFSSLVGTGSDTTQDILNALAGEANGNLFDPVRSSEGSEYRQITSWDATGTDCITPAAPGATINRPNGSSNGRRALSRAIDGGVWGDATCGGAKPTSGLVHFARSSSGPSGSGTALTYIPFGRDAVSFAYYANDVTPVTTLTSAQLTSLYETGPDEIGGVEIIPCPIQEGSGTYEFWLQRLGVDPADALVATADCGAALQENDAAALAARGAQGEFEGKQLIIGFSAANFISQSNGVAASQLAPGVDLGAIDELGKPYEGTAPNTTPDPDFYGSEVYGRDVYNVLPSSIVDGLGNADQKTVFVGSDSAVCSNEAQVIVNQFGFLSVGEDCGSTTLRGPLVS